MPRNVHPLSAALDFTGRTVVVTGAGRGLGRTTARMFTEASANVAYVSRTPHADVLQEVEARGEGAMFVAADVSIASDVRAAFARIDERFGGVDVLINNAGIAVRATLADQTAVEWDEVMAVNVRSQMLCAQAAAPLMKRAGRGRIINVSSIAGRDKSLLLGVSYSTSKAAIIGLTRHLAAELAPAITVNCICPGVHWTSMLRQALDEERETALLKKISVGFIAQPEQIASVIMFMASDCAAYMNGAIVDVNGGVW